MVCSAQGGSLPAAFCLTTPVAGRKEPAGLRALAGPPPVSCSRGCYGGRWQGAGGREQGVHWLPEEEQLKDVSAGPETRGKEASPKRVLFASTNAPCHVHSGSSEALLADTLVTSRLCRGRCEEGGGGSVGSEGCLSP